MRDRARDQVAIENAKVLVVEGPRDGAFFSWLLSRLGLDAQVVQLGGKDRQRDRLNAIRTAPEFSAVEALGVVRDSDDSPAGTFQSIGDALEALGLPRPGRCIEPCAGPPRVAVMLLPNASDPGSIEDLCLASVSREPAMTCVDKYFDCLNEKGCSDQKSLSKAKVQAFLASQPKSELWLGTAAHAGVWPFESSVLDEVKGFLKSLFA